MNITPGSADDVQRAATHLKAPPPSAAACAMSGLCTLLTERGFFVQLGNLFIATCPQISCQLCWPRGHKSKFELLPCTFCIFVQDHLSWERTLPPFGYILDGTLVSFRSSDRFDFMTQSATSYDGSKCTMDWFLDISWKTIWTKLFTRTITLHASTVPTLRYTTPARTMQQCWYSWQIIYWTCLDTGGESVERRHATSSESFHSTICSKVEHFAHSLCTYSCAVLLILTIRSRN